MSLAIATRGQLEALLSLERCFFSGEGHSPEVREAYELVLDTGEVLLEERAGEYTGMLSLVPVAGMIANDRRVRSLPPPSPLRERYARGHLEGHEDAAFVHAFASRTFSRELVGVFCDQPKLVGFVYEGDDKALRFYTRIAGCRIIGEVGNIHTPGAWDYVLTYRKP